MKFSVVLLEQYPSHEDPSKAFNMLLKQAKAAEKYGYYSAFVGEHQSTEDIYFHPTTTIAALSRETKLIKLGVSTITSLHHPIELAYSLANIDVLSGGRLIFSPVLGYRPEEFDAFQVAFKERGSRMDEAVSAIVKLWTMERVTHNGLHFQFAGVSVNPKPFQKPHPPIWVGGSSPKAMMRAIRLRAEWIPMSILPIDDLRKAFQTYLAIQKDSGVDTQRMETPVFVEACLGRTSDEARERVEKELVTKYNSYAKWGFPISVPEGGFKFDDLLDRIIVGNPDECLQKIQQFQSMGVNHLLLRFGFKGMSSDDTIESMRLWAQRVAPFFKIT